MKGQKIFLALLQRKECLVPTWRGWLVLLVAVAGLSTLAIRGAHGFLAVNDPVPGGLLVVEGWANDATMAATLEEYRRNRYEGVFVTGGPVELGGELVTYKTYADLGAATLVRMGMKPEALKAAPAEAVIRDRTYASAVALKKWLRDHGVVAGKINIMGVSAHSRRTRLLYEKAFRGDAKIGIVSSTETEFDPKRWWASSQGFRVVVDEMIAYLYARLLFSPARL
jgi:hypothetical protein